MIQEFTTTSAIQTKKLGEVLASELRGGEIICLAGDLGAGKTTFTQGLLKGLKIKGPYTSPTFSIIKKYEKNLKSKISNLKSFEIYHIDAYRINAKDLLELGFTDFTKQKNSITIVEWPEKIKKLIPTNALWINFEWINEKERKLILSSKGK